MYILISLISFGTLLLSAQSKATLEVPQLTSQQLKEDFQLLRTGLEKTHAGLYAYTTKDSLDKVLDQIEQSLKQPKTAIDFYRQICPLLKLIGNGHTNFLPPPDYNKAINTTLPRFPFAVHWYQDTLYVLRNLSKNEAITPGSIIKSINGASTTLILQQLADNLTRDGYNESWPKGKVIRDFTGKYAFFKGTPATFTLEIIDKEGSIHKVLVDALSISTLIENSKITYPKKKINKGLPLQFKVENNIGKLTINSFYLPRIKKAGQKYKVFFKKTFQQIKSQNIQHLIIDIRDNGGGWPEVVNDLFSYLIDQPYTNKTNAFTITKNLPNRKHYDGGLWDFLDMRKSFKLKKEGIIFRITGGQQHNSIAPATNSYSGEVYVLANPFTFSASTDFMGMLKNVNRGIFIGETAGGSPHQATAWIMPSLILPNSKIEAIIPLACMQTTNNFPNDGLGIAPDYFVSNSIADVLQGKDAVMEFTIKLIRP